MSGNTVPLTGNVVWPFQNTLKFFYYHAKFPPLQIIFWNGSSVFYSCKRFQQWNSSLFNRYLWWKHNVGGDDSQIVTTVQSCMRINWWRILWWTFYWSARQQEQILSWKVDFKWLSCYSNWIYSCNWVSKVSTAQFIHKFSF